MFLEYHSLLKAGTLNTPQWMNIPNLAFSNHSGISNCVSDAQSSLNLPLRMTSSICCRYCFLSMSETLLSKGCYLNISIVSPICCHFNHAWSIRICPCFLQTIFAMYSIIAACAQQDQK